MHKKNKSLAAVNHKNYLFLIFESLVIGILTGLVITTFRFFINLITSFRLNFYSVLQNNIFMLFASAAVLLISGLTVGIMIKKYPMIRGSGVAQIEGVFMQKLKMSPIPELPLKFLGGILGIGLGISVGREGPSVQIGAYVGDTVEKLGKRSFVERVCLITAGAAAGVSSTFNAPFSGVVFALEDLHQYFSPLLLACIMAGSFAADFTASLFFGAGSVFHFDTAQLFPIIKFGWLIGLGIFTAFIGHLFKNSIYFFQALYEKLHISSVIRPVFPFLLTIPAGIFFVYSTGGGDELIESLSHQTFGIKTLAMLLVVKIAFTGISAGSGAIGGIFVPLLACGALGGAIYSSLLVQLGFLETPLIPSMIVFAMAACFTTVIKAPLTACVLVFETSGASLPHLGGLVLTCLSAYITANLIGSKAHDHVMLTQLLASVGNNVKQEEKNASSSKIKQVFEIPVYPESFAALKKISEIRFPDGCFITGICRGDNEIIPDGNTSIYAGDKLIVLADTADTAKTLQELKTITGSD